MTEYNEGDLVEAVKGDRIVIDRLVKPGVSSMFKRPLYVGSPSIFAISALEDYIDRGYTVTVIEKALVPLPTTEGSIVRDGRLLGRVYVLWGGKWCACYLGEQFTEEQLRKRTNGLVVLYVEPVSS